ARARRPLRRAVAPAGAGRGARGLVSDHHDEDLLGRAYDHRLMRRLLTYLAPYKWQVVGAVAVVLLDALVQLAGPYLTKEAIDNGIRHRDLGHLDRVAVLYLCVLLVGLGLGYVHNQI